MAPFTTIIPLFGGMTFDCFRAERSRISKQAIIQPERNYQASPHGESLRIPWWWASASRVSTVEHGFKLRLWKVESVFGLSIELQRQAAAVHVLSKQCAIIEEMKFSPPFLLVSFPKSNFATCQEKFETSQFSPLSSEQTDLCTQSWLIVKSYYFVHDIDTRRPGRLKRGSEKEKKPGPLVLLLRKEEDTRRENQ